MESTLIDQNVISPSAKKVVFKDIVQLDPFEDLNFSDEEEFEETLKGKSIIQDSKIVSLFGLKSEEQLKDSKEEEDIITETNNNNNIVDKSLKESKYQESTAEISATDQTDPIEEDNSKMKSIFDNENDIISNLTDKPKPASQSRARKSSLMEDLFGSRPNSSPITEPKMSRDNINFDSTPIRSNTGESLTGLANNNAIKMNTSAGFSLSASKEPRRGRKSTVIQNDPLGLLSASNLQIDETLKVEEKSSETSITRVLSNPEVIEDLPEWLGGPKVSKEFKQDKPTSNEVLSITKSTETLGKSSGMSDQAIATTGTDNTNSTNLTSKLLGIEFDQRAALMNMQQQEHELRTAASLSQQSDKLNYLLESQKIKLTEQEKQFNMLISRQIERQSILEMQMKAQQERIDNYIKALAAQPTSIPPIHTILNKDLKLESEDDKIESESLVQKLQLEKLYLENTLDSIREKHEKEISLVEDSYKKQITFLEETMVQMEKRMQDDIECLEADYKLKIQKLKEEISETEKLHKEEKEKLKEENSKFIQEIRNRHQKSLEILQKEHTEVIERITILKESERKAVEIMKIDGINIDSMLNKSKIIIEELEKLGKNFIERDRSFADSQENHLSFHEKTIDHLKELLGKQVDAFVEEKQNLIGTIKKLELDTEELIKEFRKQNEVFKENDETLKLREQALLRDREIFVEQTNWERERLQNIRDAWAKEEDKQMAWLARERQSLAAEKGKLQIFNRLKIGDDETSKIELEATIKAAQDAAAIAHQEKLKWQEKINQLGAQENLLRERENRLVEKAKELQEFTQAAFAKREEGLRALKDAHFIEERYKEKLSQMEMQQEIIIQRENKLATEKLELARERLSYRITDIEKPEKDITKVPKSINYEDDKSNFSDIPMSTRYTTYFKDVVDPQLVLLKWDLDNKLEISKDVL